MGGGGGGEGGGLTPKPLNIPILIGVDSQVLKIMLPWIAYIIRAYRAPIIKVHQMI